MTTEKICPLIETQLKGRSTLIFLDRRDQSFVERWTPPLKGGEGDRLRFANRGGFTFAVGGGTHAN